MIEISIAILIYPFIFCGLVLFSLHMVLKFKGTVNIKADLKNCKFQIIKKI